jgi:acetyl-CoA decarbonylase/synthase complex subunit gamma
MALTGLQIQKLLPKTNCRECGSNTCMAFAMKLAAKKAELSQCPYASDEAKQVLGAASEPPVRTISLGGEPALAIGGETVLYRHDKTFVNRTSLAININDTDAQARIDETLAAIRDYFLERVGETLRVDMVSITQKGMDTAGFTALALKSWEIVRRPLVLRSEQASALAAAASVMKGKKCVLCAAAPATAPELGVAARENGHVLAVTAPSLDELAGTVDLLREQGATDIVLQFEVNGLSELFQTNSIARRSALRNNFKPLGFPSIRFIDSANQMDGTVEAVTEITKYGGIIVLPSFNPAQLSALMTLRQNIYTDPQKPIQVEPKIYPVGEPTASSPVFVTTNFSLTYFIVSGEIENSGTSAWLVVPECEGMSVLTAWAAGKFSGMSIAKFVRESGLESQVTTREIIIPGYVAQISGELEESLPGWKVVVGPQEAADIEGFVKVRLGK